MKPATVAGAVVVAKFCGGSSGKEPQAFRSSLGV